METTCLRQKTTSTCMYAEVAVNRPVHQTFHYHIPLELADKLRSGHMVEISFGTALMTGVVLDITDTTPIPKTKPIRRRLDPQPVLTPLQIELARWMATNTLTPIGACVWLMLPPGLSAQSKTIYRLLDHEAEPKTNAQKRILSLLRNRGDLSSHQLRRALPKMKWQSAINPLIKRGIVERESILAPPQATPKTVRAVRLGIPPAMIDAIATNLGRESRRGSVLEVLRAAPGRFLTLAELMITSGAGEGPIRALADDGDVKITPKQRWVELAQPAAWIQEDLDQGVFSRAPARAAVLNQLIAPGKALLREQIDASASVLKALDKMGYIRTWDEPPFVELTLTDQELRQRIIDLRGGHIYLSVLRYLAHYSGESIPISEVYAATDANLDQLRHLAEDDLIVFGEVEVIRDPMADQVVRKTLAPPLTPDQQAAWDQIQEYQTAPHWQQDTTPESTMPHVFLLHGVTGSGKTEIYMRAVAQTLAQGRQTIMLVPEIALSVQISQRFVARFPGKVAVIHSELSIGERYDTWRRARAGEVQIVLGPRSALFAPLPDVGLVILDEEHDDSYKQSPPITAPHYHTRDIAIEMMRRNRGTVILGSATPDVTTNYQAEQGNYVKVDLPDRVIAHKDDIMRQIDLLNLPEARYQPIEASEAMGAELPPVEIVDMRHELRVGNRSIFSRLLQQKLNETLEKDHQTILFLNRRGTSTYILCRDCGYIARCPNCDTSLTYHAYQDVLTCHHCGHHTPNPTTCPECGGDRIRYFGTGTEQIDRLLQEQYPEARVLRWDQDTASQKGAHQRILKTFMDQEADILVGTQMIAKGLDIPLVTLVGVISADTALGLPDYRTGERTFQLLMQVAGRAGRGYLPGEVIFQTYQPEHYAIQAAARHDYEAFYRQEIIFRRETQYPPYMQLARLLIGDKSPDVAQHEASQIAHILRVHVKQGNFTATDIIGATPCFYVRRENVFRWQVLVRSADVVEFLRDVELPSSVMIDIHPTNML